MKTLICLVVFAVIVTSNGELSPDNEELIQVNYNENKVAQFPIPESPLPIPPLPSLRANNLKKAEIDSENLYEVHAEVDDDKLVIDVDELVEKLGLSEHLERHIRDTEKKKNPKKKAKKIKKKIEDEATGGAEMAAGAAAQGGDAVKGAASQGVQTGMAMAGGASGAGDMVGQATQMGAGAAGQLGGMG